MEEQGMDRQPRRLIEQLQIIQFRQRKVIQQLQAENARLLSDLADVRQERDAFREKAARGRRENVELQNKLEEALTEHQDLKRERATLVRSVTTAAHTPLRSANLGPKILNMLSVLNEEQTESPPMTETTTTTSTTSKVNTSGQWPLLDMPVLINIKEKAARPYLHKELPNPLKSESPRHARPVSTVVS